MSTVYLLHFEPAFRHAQHYIGVTNRDDVFVRIMEHRTGQGAKLCSHAKKAGCNLMLARIWWNVERKTELRLKGRSAKPLCPICRKREKFNELR